MEKKRRYALLLCAEDSDYVKKVHGGYFQVFVRLLGDEEEEWDLFRAARGELPRGDDEIGMYDGFVITGSCNDAHGDDLWISDLVRLLKRLDSLEKKVLGICFGHQPDDNDTQQGHSIGMAFVKNINLHAVKKTCHLYEPCVGLAALGNHTGTTSSDTIHNARAYPSLSGLVGLRGSETSHVFSITYMPSYWLSGWFYSLGILS